MISLKQFIILHSGFQLSLANQPDSVQLRQLLPEVPAQPQPRAAFLRFADGCDDRQTEIAGTRRPTITFSFRPRRSSTLPDTAASVSTRVVS